MLTDHKKLQKIFAFLEEHHHWSINFQMEEWMNMLGGCSNAGDRLNALLYGIANTQSQPNLDYLAEFWQKLHDHYRHSNDTRLSAFCRFLGKDTGKPLTDLYTGLVAHKGWGHKTAALFVKNVINIHRSDTRRLHIFRDGRRLARNIGKDERIYLPVDAVIAFIFGLQGESVDVRFRRINEHIQEFAKGQPEQMLVWDDLWFWGFITQRGKGADRSMEWNAPKFWAMRSHSKSDVLELQTLAAKFIKIVQT
ncbi:hypothetical protein ACO0K9_13160 [Undibacterium sp. Ji50W]|uniref:hypothetical protein n=1 Tax=Undibacterium sp. Ji50W TaxID=3413041 RepID=UPI003BF1E4FA